MNILRIFGPLAALCVASTTWAGTAETEPNDGFGTANPVLCSDSVTGSISPDEDVDYFLLNAAPGQLLTVDVDADEVGSSLDSVVGVFDSSLVKIAFSDDDAAPGEGISFDSYLEVLVPDDGQLYIALAAFSDIDFDGDGGKSSGTYTLEIGCSVVALEPNDDFGTAVPFGCGATISAGIDTLGDLDYFVMTALPGLSVTLDVDADEIGSSLDSVLGAFTRLFDPIGTSDDDAAPGEPASKDSYLEVQVPGDGLLYVAVASTPDLDFSGDGTTTGAYGLSIGCSPEAGEPNEDFAHATEIACGAVVDGFIAPLTEVDFFRMIGVPGSTVSVDIDADELGSGLDSILGAFDSSFVELAISDDDPAPGEDLFVDSYLEVVVPADGILYIALSSFSDEDFDGGGAESTGFYSMNVGCSELPCFTGVSMEQAEGQCGATNPVGLRVQNPDCGVTEITATIEDAPDWGTAVGCTIDPGLVAAGFSCMFVQGAGGVDVTIDSATAGVIPAAADQPVATIQFDGSGGCLNDCVTPIVMEPTGVAVRDNLDLLTSVTRTPGSLTMCTCGDRGNLNCDASLCNLFDILDGVDQALGNEPESCEADVDCTCGVNLFDVLCLVDCALDDPDHCLVDPCAFTECVGSGCGGGALSAQTTESGSIVARLGSPRGAGRGRATSLVELDAVTTPVRGVRWTLEVPEGWRVDDVEPIGGLAVEPQFYQRGTTLRIVLVATDGQPVTAQNGALLRLALVADDRSVRGGPPALRLLEVEAADGSGSPLGVVIEEPRRTRRGSRIGD